jgi:predicted ATP-binding protein involved in virulence
MVTPSTARYATMFQEAASLAEADRWLRELRYKALENRQAESEQLKLLTTLLNDDLLPNQLRVAKVDSDGLWLVDRNGVELAWGEMSDGYRAVLALLADIVHHLINAYGISGLTAVDSDGCTYINRSGIVLIDEIDAHLHPEWQREVGFWLKRRFPKIQFLVTTHSPIICQAADPNGLFVLPEPGSSVQPQALCEADYRTVIASRPDTILLTPAFGLQNTRSPAAVDARSAYAWLQSKQRAGGELSAGEQERMDALAPFALNDEEL